MTNPTAKQKEEARDLSHAMTLEGVRWRRQNFWANEGQTTRDFDLLLSLLSSRDTEIREVLEGLRNPHRKTGDCWCNHDASDGSHDIACRAAQQLWKKLSPDSTTKNHDPNLQE